MQSDYAQPPKLLAGTPTNLRLFGAEEVEKDSRGHMLISRCPGSGLLDDVERDMKRSTPTTPGSSSFPSAPPTSDIKSTGPRNLSLQDLQSRGPHVVSPSGVVETGEGGGHHSSSSSSLGSLSSPTDSHGPGGVADLTPQQGGPSGGDVHIGKPGGMGQQSGGDLHNRRPGGMGQPSSGGDVVMDLYNAQLRYGETWRPLGQGHGGQQPPGQGHGGQQPPGQGHGGQQLPGQQGHGGHQLPGQGHGGQQLPGQQGHGGHQLPGQGHGGQQLPGQGHGGQQLPGQQGHGGHQLPGQGHGGQQLPGQGHRGQQLPGQGHGGQLSTLPENSRQHLGGYGGQLQHSGQGYGDTPSWQGHRGQPSRQGHGGQPDYRRQTSYETLDAETPGYHDYHVPEARLSGFHNYHGGNYHLATHAGASMSNFPSSISPSSYQPHPSHPQAPPPPYQHYPPSHPHHTHLYPSNSTHQHNPRHAPHNQLEPPPPPLNMHGSGWSQPYHVPHPLPAGSYSDSDYTPTDVPYRYLGGGESQEHLLSSYPGSSYSSHTHSSLGSLLEIDEQQRYGFKTNLRPGSLSYDPPSDRCHSFPLSQTQLHHGSRQEPFLHPQQQQQQRYPEDGYQTLQSHHYQQQQQQQGWYHNAANMSRHYPASATSDVLSRELSTALTLSEDTPTGQSVGERGQSVGHRSEGVPAGQVVASHLEGGQSIGNNLECVPAGQRDTDCLEGGQSVGDSSEGVPTGQSAGCPSEIISNTKHRLLTMLDSDRIEIVEQPQDMSAELGSKAALTCRARALNSGGVPSQQWYRGEELVAGETSVDLVVVEMERKDAGLYCCVITHPDDDSAKKCSYVAQLSVRIPATSDQVPTEGEGQGEEPKTPIIVDQPSGKIIGTIGEDLKLVLKVRGEAPLSFKWYKDTQELDYAKEDVLFIPKAVYTDSGQYCCSVSNVHGSDISNSFDVQISRIKVNNDALSLSKGGQQTSTSHYNWEGGSISDGFLRQVGQAIAQQISNWKKLVTYLGLAHSDLVEVRVQSSRPEDHALKLLYRWREKYVESRAILKKRLERAGVDFESLENSMPGGQMQGVEHMMIAKPHISAHPQSQEVIYGHEFSLSIAVSPFPSQAQHACSFQWFKNYLHLHGKTDSKLLVKSAVDSDAGEYYCTAFNKGGASDSDIAFVKVVNPHPRPVVVETAPPPHGTSWEGPRKLPSLGGRSVSVGAGRVTSSSGFQGQFAREDSRPRSWAESGGVMGAPIEGLIGRSGSIGGGGVALRSGGYLPRRGSGPSSLLEPALSAKDKPRILLHPQSQSVDAGDPLTLTCAATGEGELAFLWYFNGLSLQNENRSEYFINCFTDEDEGVYYCKVSNYWGEVNTDMAHVQMKDD